MSTFPNLRLERVYALYNSKDNEFYMEPIRNWEGSIVRMTFDELEQIYTWAASVHESNHSE